VRLTHRAAPFLFLCSWRVGPNSAQTRNVPVTLGHICCRWKPGGSAPRGSCRPHTLSIPAHLQPVRCTPLRPSWLDIADTPEHSRVCFSIRRTRLHALAPRLIRVSSMHAEATHDESIRCERRRRSTMLVTGKAPASGRFVGSLTDEHTPCPTLACCCIALSRSCKRCAARLSRAARRSHSDGQMVDVA
jgi:hypothetical protein